MFRSLLAASRLLARNKSFSLIFMFTLALGIGANTATFGAMRACLLRPLPYPNADRLFWISKGSFLPAVHYVDWSQRSRTLDAIAAYSEEERTLTGVSEPERVTALRISRPFFELLGARFLLGRDFTSAEDHPNGDSVAILSYDLWNRSFGADPQILGRPLRLDAKSYRVIGVLSKDFHFFQPADVWVPLQLDEQKVRSPGAGMLLLNAFGHLSPGATPERAIAELEHVKSPDADATERNMTFLEALRLTPLREHLFGPVRRAILILFGASALILLVACANVANLALTRIVARQNEFAIRAALGADSLHLLRQTLTENFVLTLAGGGCGLLVAWILPRVLVGLGPHSVLGPAADLVTIHIDRQALFLTLAVCLLNTVLFGFTGALQATSPRLATLIADRGRSPLFQRHRTRAALLVSEVALAVLLLIGAGLLIRSFAKVINVSPGFSTRNILTAQFSLPSAKYSDTARCASFQQQLVDAVKAMPGVEAVGATNDLPLTRSTLRTQVRVEGQEKPLGVPVSLASTDYFRTLGIPLHAGRFFDSRDVADAPLVVIVSESLSRRLFGDEEPVGRRIIVPGSGQPSTVVGIVGDVRAEGLDKDVNLGLYQPYLQAPRRRISLAVRSGVATRDLAAAVRKAVQTIDADVPAYDLMTMDERLRASLGPRRFVLILLGASALIVLALSAVGVYGVVTNVVTQRTREIGIRMALGAQGSDVLALVVRQGMVPVGWGVAIGLLAASLLARVMANLLFGIEPGDLTTFGAVAALVSAVALLACWLPADRARRADPVVALRS